MQATLVPCVSTGTYLPATAERKHEVPSGLAVTCFYCLFPDGIPCKWWQPLVTVGFPTDGPQVCPTFDSVGPLLPGGGWGEETASGPTGLSNDDRRAPNDK